MNRYGLEPKPMQDLSNVNNKARGPGDLPRSRGGFTRRLSSKRIATVTKKAKVHQAEGDGLKTAFYRLGIDLQKRTPPTKTVDLEGYSAEDPQSEFTLQRPRTETSISVETPDTIAELPPIPDLPRQKLDIELEAVDVRSSGETPHYGILALVIGGLFACVGSLSRGAPENAPTRYDPRVADVPSYPVFDDASFHNNIVPHPIG